MKVLENQHHRPLVRETPKPAEHGLEGARLAMLGILQGARSRLRHRRGKGRHLGQADEDRAGIPTEQRPELLPRPGRDRRGKGVQDRGPGWVGRTMAPPAEDQGGGRCGRGALDGLVKEPAGAHPGATGDDTVVAEPDAAAATAARTSARSRSRPTKRRLTILPGTAAL